MKPRTYVDRGGSFTDVVILESDGSCRTRKVPSDKAVVGDLAQGQLTFGTTVATNALLEAKGVSVLLLVTEGFEDLPFIGDQSRPELFDSDATWPFPFDVTIRGIPGRIDADGREVQALQGPMPVEGEGATVAIVLLNSHRNPTHELQAAKAFTDRPVILGHQTSPELGYLARIETALVDAAITPLLQAAMEADKIPAAARAIRSDGSLTAAADLRAPEAVLSGPAGGILAVSAIAKQAGFASAVGLDMGGTSTDICRVDVGRLPFREGEARVAGVRIRRPMYEIETIAAGGGSILRSDGLRLTVGPESAGADPGPQCYGRGGPPTLTDAALATGLIDPAAFTPALDPLAVKLPGPPEQFLALARESMAQAVRKLALARGRDVRDHALIAYGGAAGQHAAAVAELLGIRTILFHPCAPVLCAYGQALAAEEEHRLCALWRPLAEISDSLGDRFAALEDTFAAGGTVSRIVDLRIQGTDHALPIAWEPGRSSQAGGLEKLRSAFQREHRQRYGFIDPAAPLEVVNLRSRRRQEPRPPVFSDTDPWHIGQETIVGPQLITTPNTAISVPAGWKATRRHGLLYLEATQKVDRDHPTERTPYGAELWANRFASIAEEGGAVLCRLARSVNIRRRLDFSMGVFDAGGFLVANAPHIPVHLGSMGHTVRDLIAGQEDLRDGQAWLTNDPAAGGSHLPDLTVITPVQVGAHLFFVASRAHHVDVGGIMPGSMPPSSTCLDEEGMVFRRVLLKEDGTLTDLLSLVSGSRQPETVRADLIAQVAANHHAGTLLRDLGPGEVVASWMQILADVADESMESVIAAIAPGRAEDRLGGVHIQVQVAVKDGVLHVDFEGTGGPHAGNLNTPPAVVRAAILYVLRVLAARPIPLNEGTLRRVQISTPRPSLLAPPMGAAVVGGNVETSQRLVDLLFLALGVRAASQGTMNNLVVSGPEYCVYETIGGGCGASPAGPGVDGRQVHMTNTRSTDPEVLEARFPLRVNHFRLRRGSEGVGQHRGGMGLSRELQVLGKAEASLLASRRDLGAPGLAGGGRGSRGQDSFRRDGTWHPWNGARIDLGPGDAVRVQTPGGGGWGRAES